MELEIHPIQADILLLLLFKPGAKFKELNTTSMPTDHFNFHVKRLVKLGLIEKNKVSKYKLTTKGKEFANRFDTIGAVIEKQAKLGVLICCTKKEKSTIKYLIQQRLKEPYFGYYGFITGKMRWGETVKEATLRELSEESGYKGNVELVGVKHKMDYSKEGSLLEDKFFFVFTATDLKGKLVAEFNGGKNTWLSERGIGKLPDLFDGVLETIRMVKEGKVVFSETKYKVKSY